MDVGEEEMDLAVSIAGDRELLPHAQLRSPRSRIAHRAHDQKADERFVFHYHDFLLFRLTGKGNVEMRFPAPITLPLLRDRLLP